MKIISLSVCLVFLKELLIINKWLLIWFVKVILFVFMYFDFVNYCGVVCFIKERDCDIWKFGNDGEGIWY